MNVALKKKSLKEEIVGSCLEACLHLQHLCPECRDLFGQVIPAGAPPAMGPSPCWWSKWPRRGLTYRGDVWWLGQDQDPAQGLAGLCWTCVWWEDLPGASMCEDPKACQDARGARSHGTWWQVWDFTSISVSQKNSCLTHCTPQRQHCVDLKLVFPNCFRIGVREWLVVQRQVLSFIGEVEAWTYFGGCFHSTARVLFSQLSVALIWATCRQQVHPVLHGGLGITVDSVIARKRCSPEGLPCDGWGAGWGSSLLSLDGGTGHFWLEIQAGWGAGGSPAILFWKVLFLGRKALGWTSVSNAAHQKSHIILAVSL